MPADMKRYPTSWKAIRERILERANNKCEWCKIPNYAVAYRKREEDGAWVPLCGSGPCDAAGQGKDWPGWNSITFSEAREFAEAQNQCYAGKRRCDDDGNTWVVIVLTIAHVSNPDPMDCREENLAALCQRCHNRHDVPMRRANSKQTRVAKFYEKQEGLPI